MRIALQLCFDRLSCFFSCEEAALEVQMSVCLCVCHIVEIQPVNRGMSRGQTLQVRGM